MVRQVPQFANGGGSTHSTPAMASRPARHMQDAAQGAVARGEKPVHLGPSRRGTGFVKIAISCSAQAGTQDRQFAVDTPTPPGELRSINRKSRDFAIRLFPADLWSG
jgi:hypothetical protein